MITILVTVFVVFNAEKAAFASCVRNAMELMQFRERGSEGTVMITEPLLNVESRSPGHSVASCERHEAPAGQRRFEPPADDGSK